MTWLSRIRSKSCTCNLEYLKIMWTWNDGFVILCEDSFFLQFLFQKLKRNGQNADFWGNNQWNARQFLFDVFMYVVTMDFHFTKITISVRWISTWIRQVSSVVEVDDVSPVVRTGDVDRIRHRGVGVVGVSKTQHSVLFVYCVGDVHWESQEPPNVKIVFIWIRCKI